MADGGCPYATLGVARGAGADEIKRAYKKLVVEHHPDKHAAAGAAQQAAAAARFKCVQEAYQLLSNDRQRAAYEAARGAGRAYAHSGVNTDWSTRGAGGGAYGGAGAGAGGGYTSRLSRWEFLRRYMRDGMKSFDQPLHVGLAVLLLGGVVALDYAHNTLWEARNKGKSFEAIKARQQAGAAAAAAGEGGGGGDSSSGGGGSGSGGGGVQPLRSAWLDSMRGREVPQGQQQQQQPQQESSQQQSRRQQDADKAALLRASPPGQMAGHR